MRPDITDDLETLFTYHAPKGGQQKDGQPEVYETIRAQALHLAGVIVRESPPCRERSLAITKLEEAVMWANAGVARRS